MPSRTRRMACRYAGEAVTSTRRRSVASSEEREFHPCIGRRHPPLEHHAAVAPNLEAVAVGARGTGIREELTMRTVGAGELFQLSDQHRPRIRHGCTVVGTICYFNVEIFDSSRCDLDYGVGMSSFSSVAGRTTGAGRHRMWHMPSG
jgi:hypothetical protein